MAIFNQDIKKDTEKSTVWECLEKYRLGNGMSVDISKLKKDIYDQYGLEIQEERIEEIIKEGPIGKAYDCSYELIKTEDQSTWKIVAKLSPVEAQKRAAILQMEDKANKARKRHEHEIVWKFLESKDLNDYQNGKSKDLNDNSIFLRLSEVYKEINNQSEITISATRIREIIEKEITNKKYNRGYKIMPLINDNGRWREISESELGELDVKDKISWRIVAELNTVALKERQQRIMNKEQEKQKEEYKMQVEKMMENLMEKYPNILEIPTTKILEKVKEVKGNIPILLADTITTTRDNIIRDRIKEYLNEAGIETKEKTISLTEKIKRIFNQKEIEASGNALEGLIQKELIEYYINKCMQEKSLPAVEGIMDLFEEDEIEKSGPYLISSAKERLQNIEQKWGNPRTKIEKHLSECSRIKVKPTIHSLMSIFDEKAQMEWYITELVEGALAEYSVEK